MVRHTSLSFLAFGLSLSALLVAPDTGFAAETAAKHPGAVIYEKMCLECHGADGQGVDGKYDEPLVGNRTLEALARKIEKTMPEEKVGTCVGEDAKQVAAYIYEEFYSVAAQARKNRPTKDLLRLTIGQYRNSVTDIVGRFRNGPGFDRPLNPEAGLRGSYRGFEHPKPPEPGQEVKKGEPAKKTPYKFDRVDPNVRFHFGADSPDREKMISEEFQARWDGSVIAEETGLYEFIIKTENGVRFWVNNDQKALIDAWVSSGPEVKEEKKSLFLLGGRAYRIMLELIKFKDKSASVELWWKPPHGALELIPQEALRTDRTNHLMVVETNFPADDRSVGYERGSSISKAWDQATTNAAIATAEHVDDYLDRMAGTKPDAPDRDEKYRKFAQAFVEFAFRRPLTDTQKQLFIDSHFKAAKSSKLAVKRAVLFALKSPQFLYPVLSEKEQPDDFDVASRLALALWDSIPDRKLYQAAAEGKLRTRDQIRSHAQRMLADGRTKAKLHGFFHHWLDLEHAEHASKDPKVFPGFDENVLADLRHSLLHFIDDVVWKEKSDYRELLKADYVLLNERLGKIYGKPVKGSEFQRVAFDPKQRAGIVTHPYLLSSMAYSRQTSPIHRGVFLTRNIVGMSLKAPPMAVTFDESHFNPAFTMREKVTELTRNNACMSCHSTINPLGFSLENFDAIGRWRVQDNNKPVDPHGEFSDEQGQTVRLSGPRDIVNYVADNAAGHRAFIRNLFHHTVKQQIACYGGQVMEDLQRGFAASGCHIQKLLLDIAMVSVLEGVKLTPPPAPPAPKPKPVVSQPPPASKPAAAPANIQSVPPPAAQAKPAPQPSSAAPAAKPAAPPPAKPTAPASAPMPTASAPKTAPVPAPQATAPAAKPAVQQQSPQPAAKPTPAPQPKPTVQQQPPQSAVNPAPPKPAPASTPPPPAKPPAAPTPQAQ